MPQIDEVQVVYWGSLRPDPVELRTDGINVATGPNGSGKTTFLDAIKLMLGVGDRLARRPAEYIYDGGGDPNRKAERAYVKVIFANPERPGRAGRVFADAGGGCEHVPFVTAVCEVTSERRRYLIRPGRLQWGIARPVEAELRELTELPRSRWLSPTQWSELLARAGVSQALLGVISVQQGETDRAIAGTPEQLLRRVLELTGKQETLEGFRTARAKLASAREAYEEAARKLELERGTLENLRLRAQRHTDYIEATQRLARLRDVEIPAARHAELQARFDALAKERDGVAERLDRDRRDLAQLEADIPKLNTEIAKLEQRRERIREETRVARADLAEAVASEHELKLDLARAQQTVADAGADVQHVDALIDEAGRLERVRAELLEDRARLETERAALVAGHVLPPAEVVAFRAALKERGIDAALVAERAETPEAVVVEAVLRDGVWALVVPAARFDEAVALLGERGYRYPLARAGTGAPTGALRSLSGMPDANAYFEDVDAPVGAPGVDRSGLVRGRTWAALRAPERPVLGARARAAALKQIERRLEAIATELPDRTRAAEAARQRAERARAAVAALPRIPALETDLARSTERHRAAVERAAAIDQERDDLGPRVGELNSDREQATRRAADLRKSVAELTGRYEAVRRQVLDLRADLDATPLSAEQAAARDLAPLDVLEHEAERLERELADEQRYPADIKSELVLAQLDSQARTVAEVETLIGSRHDDLAAVTAEVDEAKRQYDEHIKQVVNLLARHFRDVCERAGMDGDIEILPSEIEGEFGIDVKVAHERGGRKRSYRNPAHSGGQKAKLAILLLLATMGLEGSADLLVMDEHIAHLDSQNIVYVAEVMAALKDRVQFILATPANAEATRLYWCDHQLAFFPRDTGEAYAPPVRIFSRLPSIVLPQASAVGADAG